GFTEVLPAPATSGRHVPLPTSQTACTCAPVAGSIIICPVSHANGPVQPLATTGMWLAWKLTARLRTGVSLQSGGASGGLEPVQRGFDSPDGSIDTVRSSSMI